MRLQGTARWVGSAATRLATARSARWRRTWPSTRPPAPSCAASPPSSPAPCAHDLLSLHPSACVLTAPGRRMWEATRVIRLRRACRRRPLRWARRRPSPPPRCAHATGLTTSGLSACCVGAGEPERGGAGGEPAEGGDGPRQPLPGLHRLVPVLVRVERRRATRGYGLCSYKRSCRDQAFESLCSSRTYL